MKAKLILFVCALGLSFQAMGKFAGFNLPRFSGPIRLQTPLPDTRPVAPPRFVYSGGTYHVITSNTYPYFKRHASGLQTPVCYRPGAQLPYGTLWLMAVGGAPLRQFARPVAWENPHLGEKRFLCACCTKAFGQYQESKTIYRSPAAQSGAFRP